jgi:hypothetical protein
VHNQRITHHGEERTVLGPPPAQLRAAAGVAILLLRWDPAVITSQWQVMNGGSQGWARAAPALRTLAHIV